MSTGTVLIVDDSLVVRAVVRQGLEEEGYRVVEATDGAAGLAMCRRELPDVVLLDVEMPDLDGYEVLAQLKRDPQLKDVPVVFLTGRVDTAHVVAALRAGAHDYLTKPFEDAELLARVASAAHVKKLQDALHRRNEELNRLSRIDGLTSVYNRRHLDEELARRHSHARRHGEPLSVLLLDLDGFKLINDTYGHPAGDLVLQTFAARLTAQLRAGDIAGRWGGEEFLVIMPRTPVAGGMEVAERIRATAEAQPVSGHGVSIALTVSGGCAGGPRASVHELVQAADASLYAAKLAGRNRMVAAVAEAHPAHADPP